MTEFVFREQSYLKSLEAIVTQLVTTTDPERTARDIVDVVSRHA